MPRRRHLEFEDQPDLGIIFVSSSMLLATSKPEGSIDESNRKNVQEAFKRQGHRTAG